jgi:hypothetical protein
MIPFRASERFNIRAGVYHSRKYRLAVDPHVLDKSFRRATPFGARQNRRRTLIPPFRRFDPSRPSQKLSGQNNGLAFEFHAESCDFMSRHVAKISVFFKRVARRAD